jgi:hypothetical protein
MSISYDPVLICGFLLPEEYNNEDKADEICKKLNCKFFIFNDGYDTQFQYAIVPKNMKETIDMSNSNDFYKIFDELNEIKIKAEAFNIKLQAPCITAKIISL